MPELPEVENVRRTLSDALVGQGVRRVRVLRRDVIHGPHRPVDLLRGQTIASVERRGKQLALTSRDGRCVCIHLGMSGALVLARPRDVRAAHTHVIWSLPLQQLRFQDPRRFGGIWTFGDRIQLLEQRWERLGQDALCIRPAHLRNKLSRTRRTLKATLLDQNVLAGLGNIYVDELLFSCRLNPLRPANTLCDDDTRRLVNHMRRLLRRAINHGGSTLRDYVDGLGRQGGFQTRHHVYGRGAKPCHCCRTPLSVIRVTGRTTVWCARCQNDGF